jgi:hypothetical protein
VLLVVSAAVAEALKAGAVQFGVTEAAVDEPFVGRISPGAVSAIAHKHTAKSPAKLQNNGDENDDELL